MNRTIKTIFCTLSLVLVAGAAACDSETEELSVQERVDAGDLDPVIEAQLESDDDADLVCSAWPEAASLPDGALGEHGLEPCVEWTDVADERPLGAADDGLEPRAGCNVWEETKYVDTGYNCGGWGGGECSGSHCCTIGVKYRRTCSACPPSVPTSCGGWYYVSSGCDCG